MKHDFSIRVFRSLIKQPTDYVEILFENNFAFFQEFCIFWKLFIIFGTFILKIVNIHFRIYLEIIFGKLEPFEITRILDGADIYT